MDVANNEMLKNIAFLVESETDKKSTLDRMINDALSTPLVLTDIKFQNIFYVNQAFNSLVGHKENSLYKQDGCFIFPDIEKEWFKNVLREAIKSGKKQTEFNLTNYDQSKKSYPVIVQRIDYKKLIYILVEIITR